MAFSLCYTALRVREYILVGQCSSLQWSSTDWSNLCQGALKLSWWVVVNQHLTKTLPVVFFCFKWSPISLRTQLYHLMLYCRGHTSGANPDIQYLALGHFRSINLLLKQGIEPAPAYIRRKLSKTYICTPLIQINLTLKYREESKESEQIPPRKAPQMGPVPLR